MNTMQFGERKPMLTFPSDKRVMVLLNERVVTIPASEEEGMEREKQTVYEYDGMFVDVAMPTEEAVLNSVKALKTDELMEYDSSVNVNEFTYGGTKMWLDKATRNGLMMRFNAEQAQNIETTSLWYNGVAYMLNVANGISMLYAIERYASECYDNTQTHKKAIYELKTIEKVVAYDYTKNYPDKLVF